MITRSLTGDGDWTFGSGTQNYRQEVEALKQSIKTRILSWNGDCFFALPEGVDWNNYFGPGRKPLLDLDIKRVLLQTEGVIRIREGSYQSTLDRAGRAVTISATVETIYGDVRITEGVNL